MFANVGGVPGGVGWLVSLRPHNPTPPLLFSVVKTYKLQANCKDDV